MRNPYSFNIKFLQCLDAFFPLFFTQWSQVGPPDDSVNMRLADLFNSKVKNIYYARMCTAEYNEKTFFIVS